MKIIKRIITLLMCLLLVVSTLFGVACKNKDEVYAPGGEPQSFKDTNIDLVKNGKSDYTIVVPADQGAVVKHAGEELQLFIKESTGCELPIVFDNTVSHDNSKKYLSVGDTTLLAEQDDIVISEEELGLGGTTINRRDNTVYIAGAAEYGTLYSVYRFLFYQINFVAYSSECVKYNYYSDLKVKDFEYSWKPASAFVSGSEDVMRNRPVDTFRMYHASAGLMGGGDGLEGSLYSGQHCHTVTYFVSKDSYPELYANGDQLCYSNPKSLEVALKTSIEKHVNSLSGPLIMVGGLDHDGYCKCDECNRQSALYGGQGGLYVRFLNALAKGIEDYFVENVIDRKLTILGLMYFSYRYAPVIDNGDGTYTVVPVDQNDEKVLWKDNIMRTGQVSTGMQYVTLDACFSHAFNDPTCEKNVYESSQITPWTAVTDCITLYHYGVNLNGFTYHFNNWTNVAGTYQFLHQYNCVSVAEESQHENGINSFHDWRAFMRGQLARNPYLDTAQLFDEWVAAMFGPASETIKEYFYSIMENYERIYNLQGSECFGIFTAIKLQGYWTRETLNHYKQLLEKARYEVERSGIDETDVILERIYKEYFLVMLNEYQSFSAYYTAEEKEAIEKEIEIGRAKYDVYR